MSHHEVVSGDRRFRKAPYAPPETGSLYSVRDKAKSERIIEVVKTSADGAYVHVVTLEGGKRTQQPIQLPVDSLARQAAKGWCFVLVPLGDRGARENVEVEKVEEQTISAEAFAAADQSDDADSTTNVQMRLDIQNFSRCSADIVRANIRFDTQLIKDIADGPFRAGNYDQAFITFEQIAVGFTSAVAASRRAIADGRQALMAQKGKLSGKEIEERKAAFVRSEQLIGAAERSFSTILEGLRMYLRWQQG